MKKILLLISAGLALGSLVGATSPAQTASPALTNVFARKSLSLDGKWRYIVDPFDTGYLDNRNEPRDQAPNPRSGFFLDRRPGTASELIEYDFDQSPSLTVPREWNTQAERLYYYEGSIWYRRRFDAPLSGPDRRQFVYFGAANHRADVYLNGRKLGSHEGGFTPFQFEVTGALQPTGNSLVVRVNNRRFPEAVPTTNTDWWNYGGLTRQVLLVDVPDTHIASYRVGLAPHADNTISFSLQLDGARSRQHGTLRIAELGVDYSFETDAEGRVSAEIATPGLQRWSPESPRLYAVEIVTETDRISERVGFRTIETRAAEILLNGRPLFLRGISIHEENPLRGGRAYSVEDARLLLGWAKELGCNFVRLAHYPHNENMARVADELGLLVWEEIPVYWTIQWTNPATLANARQQLTELIHRDQNRASVIVWSVANETPVTPARNEFLLNLAALARQLDPTRLVSSAMEVRTDPADRLHRIVDDPLVGAMDLLSFNQYIGWYSERPDVLPTIKWTIPFNKPAVISEFGADALQGFHADALTRFSEEFQEDLYRRTLRMLEGIPQWRGVSPWILADFRSPRRLLPNVQDDWNRKGLIGENGERKKAFSVLRDYYLERAKAAVHPEPAR